MITAVSEATVPKVSVIVRKAYGAGLYAMSGPAFEPDGTIVVQVGKSELGQGVRTALPMILAEELDAEFSQIRIEQAAPGPDFPRLGTGGSQSLMSLWQPLRQAGAVARTMLVGAAAARWGVAPLGSAAGHRVGGRRAPRPPTRTPGSSTSSLFAPRTS